MRTVRRVTPNELATELAQLEVALPVTLVAKTLVSMNKFTNGRGSAPNPYHNKIYKTQESNVFISIDYEKAVNTRLIKEDKEADFEAGSRKWGKHVGESSLIKKTDKNGNMNYYLQVYFITKGKPKVTYEILEDETFEPIEKEEFTDFLKPSRSSNQGLSEQNEVTVRTFKLDNIKEIRANGTTYILDM